MVALGTCLFLENLWAIWIVILFNSFLMVSHIRFVHFGRVILRHLPRTLIVIMGFVIVFIIAYLIKAKDSEMLGALLLLCFLIYAMTSSKVMLRKSAQSPS